MISAARVPDKEAIRLTIEVATRRLSELDSKEKLTRAESYEREMTVAHIERCTRLLEGDNGTVR